MGEIIGKTKIKKEKGYINYIKISEDGFLQIGHAKMREKGHNAIIGKTKIRKEKGYIYYVKIGEDDFLEIWKSKAGGRAKNEKTDEKMQEEKEAKAFILKEYFDEEGWDFYEDGRREGKWKDTLEFYDAYLKEKRGLNDKRGTKTS